jgi:hypothetical protein
MLATGSHFLNKATDMSRVEPAEHLTLKELPNAMSMAITLFHNRKVLDVAQRSLHNAQSG